MFCLSAMLAWDIIILYILLIFYILDASSILYLSITRVLIVLNEFQYDIDNISQRC